VVKKRGRPTDSPKRFVVRSRVDAETFQILQDYCEKKNKNISEALRDAIHALDGARSTP